MSVVSIKGGTINNPAEPSEEVIELLKKLLTLAEAGQVTGIAYAIHYYDGLGINGHAGIVSYNTVGHLFSIATRLSLKIDNKV
jgi:hypothetical protein